MGLDGRADYDLDNDGLIEINDLADLNAIPKYEATIALYNSTKGCPNNVCTGYELTRDINFDSNNDGQFTSADSLWANGNGWEPPILDNLTFEGNGYAIRNLNVHKAIDGRVQNAGLFSRVINSTIRNLAITGPLTSVTGDVAGLLAGSVDNSTIAWVLPTGGSRVRPQAA